MVDALPSCAGVGAFLEEETMLNGPLITCISDRAVKNDELQGARILRNEAYMQYAAMTPSALDAQAERTKRTTADRVFQWPDKCIHAGGTVQGGCFQKTARPLSGCANPLCMV